MKWLRLSEFLSCLSQRNRGCKVPVYIEKLLHEAWSPESGGSQDKLSKECETRRIFQADVGWVAASIDPASLAASLHDCEGERRCRRLPEAFFQRFTVTVPSFGLIFRWSVDDVRHAIAEIRVVRGSFSSSREERCKPDFCHLRVTQSTAFELLEKRSFFFVLNETLVSQDHSHSLFEDSISSSYSAMRRGGTTFKLSVKRTLLRASRKVFVVVASASSVTRLLLMFSTTVPVRLSTWLHGWWFKPKSGNIAYHCTDGVGKTLQACAQTLVQIGDTEPFYSQSIL